MATPDERRRFNGRERAALYLAADGRCQLCGAELEPGWHGDHIDPYSAGGPTDITNGQALCPACNLRKGSTLTTLRTWQQEALRVVGTGAKTDYLITATPGAGKTTFALALGARLLEENTVRRVVAVVPTDALRELVSATEAAFDRAILAGEEVSPQDMAAAQATARQLGIPAQYALNLLPLLQQPRPKPSPAEVITPQHRQEKMLRSEVEALARKFAYRAGVGPREVNTALRKAGFPPRAKATLDELKKMLDTLAYWHGKL